MERTTSVKQDLMFSWQWVQRWPSSGLYHCAVCSKFTDICNPEDGHLKPINISYLQPDAVVSPPTAHVWVWRKPQGSLVYRQHAHCKGEGGYYHLPGVGCAQFPMCSEQPAYHPHLKHKNTFSVVFHQMRNGVNIWTPQGWNIKDNSCTTLWCRVNYLVVCWLRDSPSVLPYQQHFPAAPFSLDQSSDGPTQKC